MLWAIARCPLVHGIGSPTGFSTLLLDIIARPICQDGAHDKVKEMIGPWGK